MGCQALFDAGQAPDGRGNYPHGCGDDRSAGKFPRLRHLWADQGYRGRDFLAGIRETHGITIQVVQRRDAGFRHTWAPAGAPPREVPLFAVVPRRWVIERSFAWLGRYRRLAKDYEYRLGISENAVYLATIMLLLHRTAARTVPRPGQVKSPAGERLSDRIALGVLTQAFPPELVDEVIAECGRAEQCHRLLPARMVVYFVLAMCLFSGQGYEEVARLLTRGLERMGRWTGTWRVPTTAAIGRARSRSRPCSPGCAGRWRPRTRADRGPGAGGWSPWTAPPSTCPTPRPTPPSSDVPTSAAGRRRAPTRR